MNPIIFNLDLELWQVIVAGFIILILGMVFIWKAADNDGDE